MFLAALPLASGTELGARALGRGGVGFADAGDPAGEQLNLAVLSFTPRYTMYIGAELGPDSRFVLRGGAIDSRTSAVTVGAGYRRITDDVAPSGRDLPGWKVPGELVSDPATHQGAHVGVAVPFLERRLSVAAHARFDWRSSALDADEQAFNFGISLAGQPVANLSLAVGTFNLLETGYARVGRMGIVGARYEPVDLVGLEVDSEIPLDDTIGVARLQVRAGVDVQPIEWLQLRGGWALESESHYASAGIAFVSERASIDYGVRIRPDSLDRNWHALDVRVEF